MILYRWVVRKEKIREVDGKTKQDEWLERHAREREMQRDNNVLRRLRFETVKS